MTQASAWATNAGECFFKTCPSVKKHSGRTSHCRQRGCARSIECFTTIGRTPPPFPKTTAPSQPKRGAVVQKSYVICARPFHLPHLTTAPPRASQAWFWRGGRLGTRRHSSGEMHQMREDPGGAEGLSAPGLTAIVFISCATPPRPPQRKWSPRRCREMVLSSCATHIPHPARQNTRRRCGSAGSSQNGSSREIRK